jgi:hypothetical protein
VSVRGRGDLRPHQPVDDLLEVVCHRRSPN